MASFMRYVSAGMGWAAAPGGVQLSSTPPLGPAGPAGGPLCVCQSHWHQRFISMMFTGLLGATAQARHGLPGRQRARMGSHGRARKAGDPLGHGKCIHPGIRHAAAGERARLSQGAGT